MPEGVKICDGMCCLDMVRHHASHLSPQASSINKSLLTLGLVIRALGDAAVSLGHEGVVQGVLGNVAYWDSGNLLDEGVSALSYGVITLGL